MVWMEAMEEKRDYFLKRKLMEISPVLGWLQTFWFMPLMYVISQSFAACSNCLIKYDCTVYMFCFFSLVLCFTFLSKIGNLLMSFDMLLVRLKKFLKYIAISPLNQLKTNIRSYICHQTVRCKLSITSCPACRYS